ncbi:Alcohol dehydrogenase YqhD, Fe-dependent ADH family [Macrococcoides canis]|uniref:NADH-dependent butanol dehydrogenase B n=1 Tax=Macrococcoides canis TaxID=1855823 RepID=A0A1W7AA08_9STAP|nr:iron-containing alcohol dehydrogenase [Macrococcus canis]ARQ06452.1 NADH-dependent butanol dehydrogenase B [Macrococcus canis]
MNQFTFYNPVKLVFGKESLEQLNDMVKAYSNGNKVLLTYGGGSIKKTGLYDKVMEKLSDFEVFELAGIEPNPRVETVRKGVEIVKENAIDFIVAVGGGSVIDGTKLIAAASKYDGDAWDIVTRKAEVKDAVPFGTVLTLSATGSEMNSGSVITNWETNEKLGWGSPLVFPKFSLLNPEVLYTLPEHQTVNGIIDSMSHLLEQYFNEADNTEVQDQMISGVMKTVMKTGPVAVKEPENYEARETLMLSSTVALNGFLRLGYVGDWATHNLEHAVSAVYDIAHGAGLAILFPEWMRYVSKQSPARFVKFAEDVFNVEAALSDEEKINYAIDELQNFWTSLGAKQKLSDYGVKEEDLEVFADKTLIYGPFGNFYKLQREDILAIYKAAL